MKYQVHYQTAISVTAEVEADTEDEAINKVREAAYLDGYSGNGGSNYLVGVLMPDVGEPHFFLDPCEGEPLEGSFEFDIDVDQITD